MKSPLRLVGASGSPRPDLPHFVVQVPTPGRYLIRVLAGPDLPAAVAAQVDPAAVLCPGLGWVLPPEPLGPHDYPAGGDPFALGPLPRPS